MTKLEDHRLQRRKWSGLLPILCRKHPKLATTLMERYRIYNQTVDYIESEVQKEKTFVIQPSKAIQVKRIERNQRKLHDLYLLGYEDAKQQFQEVRQFIDME